MSVLKIEVTDNGDDNEVDYDLTVFAGQMHCKNCCLEMLSLVIKELADIGQKIYDDELPWNPEATKH